MQTLAQVITTWEDVIARLSRESASHQGNPLTDSDSRTYATAIAYTCILLVDIRNLGQDVASDRELIGWAHTVYSLDVFDVGSFLSDALTLLRNVDEPTTYSWFKRQLFKDYPFVGKFLAPMRKVFESFLEDPSPEGFQPCSQFLSFISHLSLRDLHHMDITLSCEYIEEEQRLHSNHYPSDLLTGLRSILEEWFADLPPIGLGDSKIQSTRPDPMVDSQVESPTHQKRNHSMSARTSGFPSHGPGAVAELPRSANIQEKYQKLASDQLLEYVWSHYADVDVRSWFPYPPQSLRRQSKVVFVPKSMKTKRGISKEPAGLMYWQQAVKTWVYDFVSSHPFLSRHIDFRDQTPNQVLALQGDRFSTIDLSAASDTVTYTLVKALFSGTRLWPFLVGTRSKTAVLPDGTVVDIEKFAPMGSALCFPLETLIFSAAVEYSVRRAQRTGIGYYPTWRVFGDDIIVANPIYWDVVLVLEALHFRVNASKSFTSPKRFRESCGVEAYDDVDVTPLRLSRRFFAVDKGLTHSHASLFESSIELANACFSRRYSLLRTFVLRVTLGNELSPPRFSTDGKGAVLSLWADNYSAQRRWNKFLQRVEYEVTMVHIPKLVRPKSIPIDQDGICWDMEFDESGWYFETLRQTCERSGDMFHPDHLIRISRDVGKPKLKSKWLPRWW